MSCVSRRYRNSRSRSRVRGASYRRSSSSSKCDPCQHKHSKCKKDPCENRCGCKDWDNDWSHCGKNDWDPCRWWEYYWKHCWNDPCRRDTCHRPEYHRNVPRCDPRSGQLIRNGGFEDPVNPFRFWVTNEGVESIDPPERPHEGCNAASLNIFDPPGWIYQNVPGVCRCRYFLLSFALSRVIFFTDNDDNTEDPNRFGCSDATVQVRLEFLNAYRCPIGSPALDLEIPVGGLYLPYHTFVYVTSCPSPRDAHYARISFAVRSDRHDEDRGDLNGFFRRERILLDDVSLVAVDDD